MNAPLTQLDGRVWLMQRAALESMVRRSAESTVNAGLFDAEDDAAAARAGFELRPNGDAVIRVHGPLEARPTFFGMLFGAASYPTIVSAAQAADADPLVSRIVFDVDSPGGEASGAHDASAAIAALAKPTVAKVSGMAASAAYWLASACGRIEAGPLALVGCLGAILTVCKGSDRVVEFVSAATPLKASGPDDEGASQYQEIVDDTGDIFLADVARNRGTDRETVDSDFGRGAIMIASRALTAGMIDAVTDPATTAVRGVPGARKGVAAMADTQTAPVGAMEDEDPTREDLIRRIGELEDELAGAEGAEAEAESEADSGNVAAMSRAGLQALVGRLRSHAGGLAAANTAYETRLTTLEAESTASKVADRDRRVEAMQARGALATTDHAVRMACLAWDHEPETFAAMEASADNSAVSIPVTPGTRASHGAPEIAPDTKTAAGIRAAAEAHNLTIPQYISAERHGNLKTLEGGA